MTITLTDMADGGRSGAHLVVAFWGQSGSGKTLSALKFTRGLAGPDGKIGFLDTDNGRGRFYAKEQEAKGALYFNMPASAQRPSDFIECLRAFEDANVDAVLIDSASAEWLAVVAMADAARTKSGRPLEGLAKWRAPKAEHARFVQFLLNTKMHVILCLKAKSEYEQRKDDKGNQVILDHGPRPVMDDGFVYDATICGEVFDKGFIRFDHRMFGKLTGIPESIFAGKKVSVETGAAVAEWLNSKPRDYALNALERAARDAADGGTTPLRAFWEARSGQERSDLGKPLLEELKTIAAKVDAELSAVAQVEADMASLADPFGTGEAA